MINAHVQYDDYKGTVAADVADYTTLDDYLTSKGVDVSRFTIVGIEAYSYYNDFSFKIIAKYNNSANEQFVYFVSDQFKSAEEFFNLFKRFNIVMLIGDHNNINVVDTIII